MRSKLRVRSHRKIADIYQILLTLKMKVQNFSLFDSYALRDDELRRLEKKQRLTINVLKRDCKKLDENKAKDLPGFKAWKQKQVQRDYTFKLPKTSIIQPQPEREIFKHGWKVRSESEISEDAKQKLQQRSQMLLAGNVYSMKNKSCGSSPILKNRQSKSVDEVRKEIIVKSKELGNRYSQCFMKARKSSSDLSENIHRYHLLLWKKNKIEQQYQNYCNSRQKIPNSLPLQYSNLIDEIEEAEKTLKIKTRGELKIRLKSSGNLF